MPKHNRHSRYSGSTPDSDGIPATIDPNPLAELWKTGTSRSNVFRIRLPDLNWAIRLKDMKNTIRPVASRPNARLSNRSRITSGTVIAPEIRAT